MLVKIVLITLAAPAGKQVETSALLDEGSTATLIVLITALELGLKGRRDPLTLMGVSGVQTYDPRSKATEVKIRGVGTREYSLEMFRTENKLSLPTQTLSDDDVSFVRRVSAGDLCKLATPKVLVDQDHWKLIISLETRTAPWCDLALSHTRLGWTVHGKMRYGSRPNLASTFV